MIATRARLQVSSYHHNPHTGSEVGNLAIRRCRGFSFPDLSTCVVTVSIPKTRPEIILAPSSLRANREASIEPLVMGCHHVRNVMDIATQ